MADLKENRFVSDTIENVKTDLIIISEDKLRNKLNSHVPRIEEGNSWKGMLTTFISLVATVYACQFEDKLGIKAATWAALYIIGIIITLMFLIKSIFNYLGKSDVDSIICDIKDSGEINSEQSREYKFYGIIFHKWRVRFKSTIKVPSEVEATRE